MTPRKRAALVGAGLLAFGMLRGTPGPAPAHAPARASLAVSKPLASLAPALPTPGPLQAPQRRLRPREKPLPRASRSRASRERSESVGVPYILTRVRGCESGNGPTSPGNYRLGNPVSSASGAYQFLDSTWAYVTHLPPPASAYSKETQDWAAVKLYHSEGLTPWNESRYCWS